MKLLDEQELAEIKERCEKATKGQWYTVGQPWNDGPLYVIAGHHDPHLGVAICDCVEIMEWENGEEPVYTQSDIDMEFIAASRTDVPALLEHIEILERITGNLCKFAYETDDDAVNISLEEYLAAWQRAAMYELEAEGK